MNTSSSAPVDEFGTNESDLDENSARGSCYFDIPLSEIDPLALTSQIPEAFERFVHSLASELQLRRAGFIIAHQTPPAANASLSVITISVGSTVCAGLGIEIPRHNSALHEICDSHCLKTIVPAEDFQGNFAERHVLLVSTSGALGMYPLETNGLLLGAVTLNCYNRSVFENASAEIHDAVDKLALHVVELIPRSWASAQTLIDA